MKLVLHIGTHKTATTTIQKNLARHRRQLVKRGVWYPRYSEVLAEARDHYAHLDLAKGLMGESQRFTPHMVAEFFRALPERASAMRKVDTVLLSSEPFYRGRTRGEGEYWKHRREFVARVREIIPFDLVDIILVVRRQDDYLESLYNEHVKTTRYSGDIWQFLADYRSRFEYRRQIDLWSEYFPTVNVCTFETLIARSSVTAAFLEFAVGRRRIKLGDPLAETNVSLPTDLVEYKRLLNQTSLDRHELGELVSSLERVATARQSGGAKAKWLSASERRKVLSEFSDDNEWLSGRLGAESPKSAFPDQVDDRPVFEGLDVGSFAELTAELLRERSPRATGDSS